MKIFYLVWNEQGNCPTFKHRSFASAEQEAKRLAKQNPGQQFHVLSSSCTFEVPDPVVMTIHQQVEDMPF